MFREAVNSLDRLLAMKKGERIAQQRSQRNSMYQINCFLASAFTSSSLQHAGALVGMLPTAAVEAWQLWPQ